MMGLNLLLAVLLSYQCIGIIKCEDKSVSQLEGETAQSLAPMLLRAKREDDTDGSNVPYSTASDDNGMIDENESPVTIKTTTTTKKPAAPTTMKPPPVPTTKPIITTKKAVPPKPSNGQIVATTTQKIGASIHFPK